MNSGDEHMTFEKISENLKRYVNYFTFRDLVIIFFLAILAVITGTFAPDYIAQGGVPTIMHGILKLPGPGAGIMLFGGTLCFSFVLGLLLIRKPRTAVVMSLLVIAMDLVIGKQAVVVVSMNFYSLIIILVIAVMIEGLARLHWENRPLKLVIPVVLAGLGLITLYLFLTGQVKMPGGATAATTFPIGYVITALLALAFAIICYRYPLKYFAGCAIATMYYILHFWLFFGKSFASSFPASPDIIPVLFCVAAVGGVLFAALAYGIDTLGKIYFGMDKSGS